MDNLPSNIKEIFEFINWFLITATMLSLYARARKFKDVPLSGSWFRWKAFGYTIIIFIIDMLCIYYTWKGDALFTTIRLTSNRILVLWETEYCHNFRFNRLPPMMKYVLTHPWSIDPTIKEYVPLTDRLMEHRFSLWLKKALGQLHSKIFKMQQD